MIPIRVSIIVVACMAAAVAASQAPSEPHRFRVAIDVVSIDAVVTDRKGEVVRDLIAADFEVFQDGTRQKVKGPPGVPAPPITRKQVRRAIILVVDDLGLSVEGLNKTVVFAFEGFQLAVGTDATTIPDQDTEVRYAVDRVVDQATRSGVVIYAIDGQALQPAGLRASDDIHSIDTRQNPDAVAGVARGLAADRQRAIRDAQESLAYLAEQTGGFAVVNTNDLAGGFRRISNDVRDYYVIGYEPDPNTFALEGKPPRLHQIAVNVRRAGVRVRTRKQAPGRMVQRDHVRSPR